MKDLRQFSLIRLNHEKSFNRRSKQPFLKPNFSQQSSSWFVKFAFCTVLKMENFTEHEYGDFSIAFTQLTISTLPASIAIFLPALNVCLAITTSLGNALILVALNKVTSLHPPTKLLFRCLAVTDLCVGLISQPLYATLLFLRYQEEKNRKLFFYVAKLYTGLNFFLCALSIFVSTAISVDRLLALILGLSYRQVVTLRRIRVLIICFWFVITSSEFVFFFWSFRITLKIALVFVILCLVISIFSYTKIYFWLRQHQAQVQNNLHGHQEQGQPNGERPLNIAKYKKTVFSIAWVQFALVACYVPFGITVALTNPNSAWSTARLVAWFSSVTLIYLNSSLNTFLYCWKIREVRQAVKDTIKQICCLSA